MKIDRCIPRLPGGRILGDFLVYIVSGGLNAAIPFLLLPVLTRFLSREDYGLLAVFNGLVSTTVIFVGVNTAGAINREFFNPKEIRIGEYVGNCFFILGCGTLVMLGFYEITGAWFVSRFSIPAALLVVVVLAAAGANVMSYVLTYFRVNEKPIGFGSYQVGSSVIEYGLTLYLIVVVQMDWAGRVIGLAGKILIMALLGLWILYRSGWLVLKWNPAYLRSALRFSVPLIPHRLGTLASHIIDRMLVAYWLGLDSAGVFTVGANISRVLIIAQEAFINAWVPWTYKQLSTNEVAGRRKIVLSAYGFIAGLALLCAALVFGARYFMPWLVGDAFQDAARYLPWLGAAYVFSGGCRLFAGLVLYTRKTHFLSAVTLSTTLLNVLLVSLLLQVNGAVGAAQATCLSYFISMIFLWVLSMRLLPLPWFLLEAEEKSKK